MNKVEQYIEDYTRDCSNELDSYQTNTGAWVDTYHEWLTPDDARAVAKIAREEMIEKAATWFANRYQVQGGYLNSTDIDDFRKEMMEE